MIAEIITTGEEVMSGQIIDTNAAWLAEFLGELGFDIARRTTVGDRMEDLVSVFKDRSPHADVIIVNGGLGPTVDDLSSAAAAAAMGVPLEENEHWVHVLTARYEKMGRTMSKSNLKQALLPEGALFLDNPVGTACGFAVKLNRAWLYFTPGPPRELHTMMRGPILQHLNSCYQVGSKLVLRKLECFGLGESTLDDMLAGLNLPSEVNLGFRVHFPICEIKLSYRPEDPGSGLKPLEEAQRLVMGRIGDFIMCIDEERPSQWVQEEMIKRDYSLALAESCTGGMLSEMLVHNAGSSAYFDRGFVTYTNQAKQEMIGVPEDTLRQYGAVSMETATAMAVGAKLRAGTTHALAITGIAGPSGGSDEKPVGTVAFSLATPDQVHTRMLQAPPWGRTRIRQASAVIALDMLRRHLAGVEIFGNYDLAVSKGTSVMSFDQAESLVNLG